MSPKTSPSIGIYFSIPHPQLKQGPLLFCLNKVQSPQWHEPKMLFVGFRSPCCIICGCILAWLEVEWLNSHTKLLQAADRIKPFTEMEGSMRDMIRKLKAYDWAMRSAEAKETADAALKDHGSALGPARGHGWRVEHIQVQLHHSTLSNAIVCHAPQGPIHLPLIEARAALWR